MNGYEPSNTILLPHAVDPKLHNIISRDDLRIQQLLYTLKASSKIIDYKNSVVFCGRYWDKTYTKRKNYEKIVAVSQILASQKIPVLSSVPIGIKSFHG